MEQKWKRSSEIIDRGVGGVYEKINHKEDNKKRERTADFCSK